MTRRSSPTDRPPFLASAGVGALLACVIVLSIWFLGAEYGPVIAERLP